MLASKKAAPKKERRKTLVSALPIWSNVRKELAELEEISNEKEIIRGERGLRRMIRKDRKANLKAKMELKNNFL